MSDGYRVFCGPCAGLLQGGTTQNLRFKPMYVETTDDELLAAILRQGERSSAFTSVRLSMAGGVERVVDFLFVGQNGMIRKAQRIDAHVRVVEGYVVGVYSKLSAKNSFPTNAFAEPIEVFRVPVSNDSALVASDVVNRLATFFAAKRR